MIVDKFDKSLKTRAYHFSSFLYIIFAILFRLALFSSIVVLKVRRREREERFDGNDRC